MWPGEQAPPPLPPPMGSGYDFPAENPFDWKFERAAALSSSPGVRKGQIPLRTSLSQIPLKSCGFPGAESARKRFFLRGASPHSEKISTRVRRAGRRPRLKVERVHTLSSSPGAVWRENWFPTKQAVLLRALFPTPQTWGAPLPYTPSGDGVREGSHPLALSRGAVLVESLISDGTHAQ